MKSLEREGKKNRVRFTRSLSGIPTGPGRRSGGRASCPSLNTSLTHLYAAPVFSAVDGAVQGMQAQAGTAPLLNISN